MSDQNDISEYNLIRDRERRNVKAPSRYGYADMVAWALICAEEIEFDEPRTYNEALKSKESKKWIKVMEEEFDSLVKNKTWILVDKVKNQRVVSCRWIFKRKEVAGVRYKARLIAGGFLQREGIDYNEIYAPVVKHKTIRLILSMVAHYDMELEQLDVKTAFLYVDLEENILMSQSEGFIKAGHENKVCLLKNLFMV